MKLPDFGKFLLVFLGLLGAVYSLGASHLFSDGSHPGAPAAAASVPEPGVSKTYYGYFADFKDDGTPTISDETLSFEFLPNSEVKATSQGVDDSQHGRIPKMWKYAGFLKGSRLSMSYSTVSTKDDPIAPGVGQFLLEQQNSSDYTGTIVYLNCARGRIMQCPYALTTRYLDGADAKKRWPKLFERTCDEVVLIPDRVQITSSTTSCKLAKAN